MVASSSDVIGLADPDGTIRYLTPSIARIAGVPLEDWIGQRFDVMLTRHIDGIDDLADSQCAPRSRRVGDVGVLDPLDQ